MRDQNPIRTARRKARQLERERQGIAVPPCIFCIQEHHTAGKHHDPQLKAPICEMHHREMHERLLRAGISLEREPDQIKRVALALRSAAVYDHHRADAMERWAGLLERHSEATHEQESLRRRRSGHLRTSAHSRATKPGGAPKSKD